MAVLKCTVCGGELDVNADMSVGVCKYCDSVITIPKELDRKGRLYNRAIFLRQNNEFDKAVATYEDILKEDNGDAEAHWGLVLSKYGIEYVSDPRTSEKIPTCHRTQLSSILSDPDYLAAIEYSDMESRRVIEKEAKRIHEIQSRIIEISRKEPPYDIFICYKESDELGNRTEDSVLAQELYYELQKKGYRVFFARKTLESKLGTEYEPIIFAALNAAKVMIVLGTKPEHFSAVWVRNEWSRFSKMAKDTHKVIIPAYRGMSPYELPEELSTLQSQDMSKIGFMQDLTDGIERCMRSEIKKKEVVEENGSVAAGVGAIERLIKNGETYLKLENLASAEEAYTTATKNYPEDHRGWWGLIVCKTENFSKEIVDPSTVKTLDLWFGYVKKLAGPAAYSELEKKYVAYIDRLALMDASKDMEAVSRIIEKQNDEIRSLKVDIRMANTAIEDKKKELAETINRMKNSVPEFEKRIAEYEAMKKKKSGLIVIGVILAVVGIIVIPINIELLAISLCLWVASIVCFIGAPGVDSFEKINTKIIVLKANLAQMDGKIEQEKKQKEAEIEMVRNKVNSLQKKMEEAQRKIDNCNKYLELGKEKIATYWSAKRCKVLGVERSCDSRIEKLRETVYAIAPKA